MDQTAVQDWLLTRAKDIAETLFKALLGRLGESARQKLFGKSVEAERLGALEAGVVAFLKELPGLREDEVPFIRDVFNTPQVLACLAPLTDDDLALTKTLLEGAAPHFAQAVTPHFPLDFIDNALEALVRTYRKGQLSSDRLRALAEHRHLEAIRQTLQGTIPDLAAWLHWIDETHGRMDLRGIGKTNEVLRPRIEELYTPLKATRSGGPADASLREDGLGAPDLREDGLRAAAHRPELGGLLAQHRRLLIVGQPGAGKSTFLMLIATMMARDLARQPGPLGKTWRETHLGLPPDEVPALIPIPLRASDLAKGSGLRSDPERALFDAIATRRDIASTDGVHDWLRAHFQRQDVILLVDGLDEVSNRQERDHVVDVLRSLLAKWPTIRVVLATR